MLDTREALVDVVSRHANEATIHTVLPGVILFRVESPTTPVECVYEPRFCITVQGSKQVVLGDKIFDYNSANYLITTVDLPVTGQVLQATPEKPYLAVCFTLSAADIASLLLDMKSGSRGTESACNMCLGLGQLTGDILDSVSRIIKLLDTPDDIPILFPLFKRELLYRLLQGKQGATLRQIATSESNLSQINRSINWIKKHYAEQFSVEAVAEIADMSPSTFHRNFRSATTMSPLQYRTRIRLQEARRKLMTEGGDVAEIGYSVGYDSPSQFSREYRRMFGRPPLRDISGLRQDALVGTFAQVDT